jgi:hypothetical protein
MFDPGLAREITSTGLKILDEMVKVAGEKGFEIR